MRIKVEFSFNKNSINLPLSYNNYLQALLYNTFSKELGEFLHNKGYIINNRHFKLFTFSRLFGKYIVSGTNIIFKSPIYFYLSSPFNDVLSEFANTAFKTKESLKLGTNDVFCSSISVYKGFNFNINTEYKIKMISPITIYSTLSMDDKKKTFYYGPHDIEFKNLIEANLKKKYKAVHQKDIPYDSNFTIEPYKVDLKKHFILTKFKDTIIKGWMGIYKVKGDPELLKIAYNAGLGSKNSAGFGMWEILK